MTRALAGTAASLLLIAGLSLVVRPLLLKAPLDIRLDLRSSGAATVLDRATGRPVAGTFLQASSVRSHLRGGSRAGSATTAAYDQVSQSSIDGRVLATSRVTQAFDRSTGAGRPGRQGDQLGTTAHVFKLPFGTRRRTYPVWDETARKAVDLDYAGDAVVGGLPVYVFHRDVAPTDLGPLPVFGAVPAAWLGLPGRGSVPVHEWYENRDSTLYVEPVTGSFVGGASSPHLWAQTQDGRRLDLLTVTAATPVPAASERLVRAARHARDQVLLLRRTPWLLGTAAVVLLALAGGLHRRGSSRVDHRLPVAEQG